MHNMTFYSPWRSQKKIKGKEGFENDDPSTVKEGGRVVRIDFSKYVGGCN